MILGAPLEWSPCLMTMKDTGRAKPVRCLAISPDGSLVVSGLLDSTLQIWDAVTGNDMLKLKGHIEAVDAVIFSPDGSRLVSSSYGSIIIWDPVTGQSLLKLDTRRGTAKSLSFSPNGSLVLAGMSEGGVRTWDVHTGVESIPLEPNGLLVAAAFSLDGKRVALAPGGASGAGIVHVRDVIAGEGSVVLNRYPQRIISLAFSLDGSRLASGTYDNAVVIWNPCTGDLLTILSGHFRAVTSIAFSPDGGRIVSGSSDKTIRVWDVASAANVTALEGHSQSVASVIYSPDGNRILSGSEDATVRIWEAASSGTHGRRLGHPHSAVTYVSISSDGSQVISVSRDGTMIFWESSTGRVLQNLKVGTGIDCLALSSDERRVAYGSGSQSYVWDIAPPMRLASYDVDPYDQVDDVVSVSLSSDGRCVASGTAFGIIHIWNLSGECLRTMGIAYDHPIVSMAFSPDGALLASGSQGKIIRLWKTSTGHCTQEFRGHSKSVAWIKFAANSTQLASVSYDETARMWKIDPTPTDDPGVLPIPDALGDTAPSFAFRPICESRGLNRLSAFDKSGAKHIVCLMPPTFVGMQADMYNSDDSRCRIAVGSAEGQVVILETTL